MTQASNFGQAWFQAITNLINDLETLRTLNDRVGQDSTLFTQYLASPGARTDVSGTDLTNSASAVTQMLFTFDSGAPTQKSLLFKML